MLTEPRAEPERERLQSRFLAASRALALALGALGTSVLLGWLVDSPSLKSLGSTLPEMKPNTALCLLLLAVVAWLGASNRSRSYRTVAAVVVVGVAALTLLEHATQKSWGIDELLFRDPREQLAPGRMAPVTAAALFCLGLGALLLDRTRATLGSLLIHLALIASFVAGLGYIYGASSLYRLPGSVAMAAHTSIGLCLAALALLMSRPMLGWLAVLTSSTIAGALLRRVLPIVPPLLVALGALRLEAQAAGYFDTRFGVALHIATSTVLVTLVTILAARTLFASELRASATAAALAESELRTGAILERLGERMRFFELSIDMLCVGDTSGHFIDVSPAFERVLGYSKDELLARPFLELVHPDDRAATEERLLDLRQGRHNLDAKNRYLCKDGSYKWLQWRSAPDADGLIYAVARDITRDLEAQEELGARETKLRSALREREILLQEVHHRVKNNLQIISSLIRMQGRRLPGGDARSALEDCGERVQAIALIHEQLYQSNDFTEVPFSRYATALVKNIFETQAEPRRSLELDVRIAPTPLPVSQAIPCGLILNELVTNALKHAFRATDTGRIEVVMQTLADGRMALSVSDDGSGLPQDETFERPQSLGMQLVRTLVTQLGGELDIAREPKTRFTVSFALEKTAPIGNVRSPSHWPTHSAIDS